MTNLNNKIEEFRASRFLALTDENKSIDEINEQVTIVVKEAAQNDKTKV